MKMKRLREGMYETTIGNLRVRIARYWGRWYGVIYEGKIRWSVGKASRTLEACQERCGVAWVRVQMLEIRDLIKGSVAEYVYTSEFLSLWQSAYVGAADAIAMLADWLADHGREEMLQRRIVIPGVAAGLIWPTGWESMVRSTGKGM